MANDDICPIFGLASDLSTRQLPTKADLIRYYPVLKETLQKEQKTKKISVKDINKRMRDELRAIWLQARINTIEPLSIYGKLNNVRAAYNLKLKLQKVRKTDESTSWEKIDQYREECEVLFDISKCDCRNCSYCDCVTDDDWLFLEDQKTVRLEFIKVDAQLDAEFKNRCDMRESAENEESNQANEEADNDNEDEDEDEDENDDDYDDDDDWTEDVRGDPDWTEREPSSSQSSQNRTDISEFAEICIRYKDQPLTSAIAAVLANVVMKMHGVVSKNDFTELIDRSKIERSKDKVRKIAIDDQIMNSKPIRDLGYDSKIDKKSLKSFLKILKRNDELSTIRSTRLVPQEHYVLLDQENKSFLKILTFDVPDKGKREKACQTVTDIEETITDDERFDAELDDAVTVLEASTSQSKGSISVKVVSGSS